MYGLWLKSLEKQIRKRKNEWASHVLQSIYETINENSSEQAYVEILAYLKLLKIEFNLSKYVMKFWSTNARVYAISGYLKMFERNH